MYPGYTLYHLIDFFGISLVVSSFFLECDGCLESLGFFAIGDYKAFFEEDDDDDGEVPNRCPLLNF